MKSNIINMAEKLSDAEDRYLESVFRADAISDNGFSKRVTAKIRRRIWIDRLALPVAAAVGAIFAFHPATKLLSAIGPESGLSPLLDKMSRLTAVLIELPVYEVAVGSLMVVAGFSLLKVLSD